MFQREDQFPAVIIFWIKSRVKCLNPGWAQPYLASNMVGLAGMEWDKKIIYAFPKLNPPFRYFFAYY